VIACRALRLSLLGCILLHAVASVCFARAAGTTATLRGAVVDPSDAVIESPRGVWWNGQLELATPGEGSGRGRSYAANIVQVLSPSLTNEVLATFSRLALDNSFRGKSDRRHQRERKEHV
jgi:hypothetical protein